MSDATAFISSILENVTVSDFVAPEDLVRIRGGGVVAVHVDLGEDVPLGDGQVQFVGGEPSPFPPTRRTGG